MNQGGLPSTTSSLKDMARRPSVASPGPATSNLVGGGSSGLSSAAAAVAASPSISSSGGPVVSLWTRVGSIGPDEIEQVTVLLEASLKFFRNKIPNVLSRADSYSASGSLDQESKFADEVLEFALSASQLKADTLSTHLKRIGPVLKEIEALRGNSLEMLRSEFMIKLNSFCRGDLEMVEMFKKKLEQSLVDYEAFEVKAAVARSKVSSKSAVTRRRVPSSTSTVMAAAAAGGGNAGTGVSGGLLAQVEGDEVSAELVERKRALELSQLNYMRLLCEVNSKKDCAILISFAGYLNALQAFVENASAQLRKIAPELREVATAVNEEYARYMDSVQNVDMKDILSNVSMSSTKVKKQGYLMVRKIKTKTTKKRWLDLENNMLSMYSSHKETGSPSMQLDLLQISLRANAAQPTIVVMVKPDMESICLVATSAEEMESWMRAFESAIQRGKSSASAGGKDVGGAASSLFGVHKPKNDTTSAAATLRKASELNRICADCSMAEPIVVNVPFGVLVCAECAVLHQRAFPQSVLMPLEASDWDPEVLITVRKLGNATANLILESTLPRLLKPHPMSESFVRARFVNAKYGLRKFVEPLEDGQTTEGLRKTFEAAVRKDDLVRIYRCVMQGLDLRFAESYGRTLMHQLVAQGGLSVSTFIFLLHHVPDVMRLVDHNADSLLHYCATFDRGSFARNLLKFGADPTAVNKDGLSAEDLAQKKGSREFLKALASAAADSVAALSGVSSSSHLSTTGNHVNSGSSTSNMNNNASASNNMNNPNGGSGNSPASPGVGGHANSSSSVPTSVANPNNGGTPGRRMNKLRSSEDMLAAGESSGNLSGGPESAEMMLQVKRAAREHIVQIQSDLVTIKANSMMFRDRCNAEGRKRDAESAQLLSWLAFLSPLQASLQALQMPNRPPPLNGTNSSDK